MFRFKQFTVKDESCGMKVGTDGVLLGAWTPVDASYRRVLDVGTGSGLIALMLAQRSEAQVLAIDVDEAAVFQAKDNFSNSPWAERLAAAHIPLQELQTEPFDLIVSNPPYFVDSLKNPDAQRRAARHTDTLSQEELLEGARRLLTENGMLAVILPAEMEGAFLALAQQRGLTPYKITRVHTREGKPAKRVLMALRKPISPIRPISPITPPLVLIDESGAPRSAAYEELCREFYL